MLCVGVVSADRSILFVLTDEWRANPPDTPESILNWQREHLTALESLKKRGINWEQHRIAGSACVASRISLLTSLYPDEHGATQTDGAAKLAWDPDMRWLDPSTAPTLGHWLSSKYRPVWFGKWHADHADLLWPGTHESINSYMSSGEPDPEMENLYREQDRLAPFGFHDWVGPDPHGRSAMNSGTSSSITPGGGRDATFTQHLIEYIQTQVKPFAAVWAPVGTHDTATFGDVTRHMDSWSYPIDPTIPRPIPPSITANMSLADKPSTQKSYRDIYPIAFQPVHDPEEAAAVYYSLMAETDRRLQMILDALEKSPHANTTWIVFTSDHGTMLGMWGLWQKFHVANDAVLRVPMVWVPPRDDADKFAHGISVQDLTSHIDVLPTLVDLLGLRLKTAEAFITTRQRGRSRTDLFQEMRTMDMTRQTARFYTSDDPTRGQTPLDWSGTRYYKPVQGPTVIDAYIVRDTEGRLTKLVHYSDPEGVWRDEWEMYDLDQDPLELVNLAK